MWLCKRVLFDLLNFIKLIHVIYCTKTHPFTLIYQKNMGTTTTEFTVTGSINLWIMCQSLQSKRSKRLKHIKMCNVFIHSFKNYQNHYRTSLMHCIKMGHWHMLRDIVLLIRWYSSINQNTYSFEHQAYLLINWGNEEVNINMLFAQMKSPNI